MRLSLSTTAIALISQIACSRASPRVEEFHKRTATGLRLIGLQDDVEVWRTEDEVFGLMRARVDFVDLTDSFLLEADINEKIVNSYAAEATKSTPSPFPWKMKHQHKVKHILKTMSLPQMQLYLGNLTLFHNRYMRTTYGRDAALWIKDTVAEIIRASPLNATVETWNHTHIQDVWIQPSVIAKFPGATPDAPRVIVGAHLDSVNVESDGTVDDARAPGADDDGSGTVNLIEAFRALANANFRPSFPLEFHWYAAEESGLRGSRDIATVYKANDVPVRGMLQIDMSAYVHPTSPPAIRFIADRTDPALNEFGVKVASEYLATPAYINASNICGYGCSDHHNWWNRSYPASFPFESLMEESNPVIHTEFDTIDAPGFNWTHSFEFAKFVAAWAYELAA